MNSSYIERLFKSVFSNIVLFRNIFKYVRLYNKNDKMYFSDRKQLQEYQEREYIQTLIYLSDEALEIGDLPVGGVLKHVKLERRELVSNKGEVIPYGVEIIEYSKSRTQKNIIDNTPFSTLPSSIHTINDAVIVLQELSPPPIIPSNITSISFHTCPSISLSNNGYIKIPNTIRDLDLGSWDNNEIPLNVGDIPYGVTRLSMMGYDITNLSKSILPNSIKELQIACLFKNLDYNSSLFNIIPTSVETILLGSFGSITPELELMRCINIKKLTITFTKGITPFSLPPNLTELKLVLFYGDLKKNLIPSTVTNLEITFECPEQFLIENESIPNSVQSLSINKIITCQIPSSLKSLELVTVFCESHSIEDTNKMLSKLPSTITSLSLPRSLCSKLSIPSTIKTIKYNY